MWRLFALVAVQTAFLSGGQVFLKLAMEKLGRFEWSWAYFKTVLTDWWLLVSETAAQRYTLLWVPCLTSS